MNFYTLFILTFLAVINHRFLLSLTENHIIMTRLGSFLYVFKSYIYL